MSFANVGTTNAGTFTCLLYTSTDAKGRTAARVHHSHVIRFTGRELPEIERMAEMYWGESEVEALYKEVVAHDKMCIRDSL